MNLKLKNIFILIAILLSFYDTNAQNIGLLKESTYIKTYGINELHKFIYIADINEDSRGCIVMATSDGLLIMDSQNTNYYTSTNYTGMSKLKILNDNKIMIVGDVDLGYFEPEKNGNLKFVDIGNNIDLKAEKIQDLFAINDTIYFVGNNAIFELVDATKQLSKINTGPIESAFQYGDKCFIISQEQKIHSFDGKYTREILNLKKLSTKKFRLLEGSNDIFLISGSDNYKISKKEFLVNKAIDATQLKKINNTINILGTTKIYSLCCDTTLHIIAAGTNKGVLIFDENGKHLQTINYDSGLPSNDALKVFFDSRHNLWVSMESVLSQIDLLSPTVFYSERQGITGEISNISKIDDKYYFTKFRGIYSTNYDTISHSTKFEKLNFGNNDIICWNIQKLDNKLIACTSNGLYSIDNNKSEKILDCGITYSFCKSSKLPGKIVIASYDGLFLADYNNGVFGKPQKVNGLDFAVWSATTDDDGKIWISSVFNGIYCVNPKNNNLESFSIINIGQNVGNEELRQANFQIANNKLFIYGSNFKWSELPFKQDYLASDIQLKTDTILLKYLNNYKHIEVFPTDNKGSIFINNGKNYLLATKKFNGYNIDTLKFPTEIKVIYRVSHFDSMLLISTESGILKYDLAANNSQNLGHQQFKTIISEIEAGDSIIFSGTNYRKNIKTQDDETIDVFMSDEITKIKLKFSSSCFYNPEQLKYSYWLEGRDKEWTAFSKDQHHTFGNLNEGGYKLHVVAKNSDGIVGDEATYEFYIKNPIYWRWWMKIIYGFLTIALLSQILLHYIKENQRLKEINKEKNDEIIRQNERLKLLSLVASKNTNSVIILNQNGKIEWANDSFTNFYGYTLKEYKEQFGDDYMKTQLEYSPVAYIIEQAQKEKIRTSYETTHIGPNNHKVYVQTHLDPVFDTSNELKNWIVTETNITQLKLAEKEGLEQTEKLVIAYSDLKKSQSKMEFQTKQLLIINERLETGYKQIRLQNKTIKESLKYAQSIQYSILPTREKISQVVNHFLIYWPKDIVSGDFYMCEKISDKSFITIVADCTGHGVPGAFMSIVGHNILAQIIILQKVAEPQQILELLSDQLIDMLNMEKLQNTDGIALSICRFDKKPDGVTITAAQSGSSLYIFDKQKGELKRYRGSRRQIGINARWSNQQFEQITCEIHYEDRVFQFSDGIIDQCNTERQRYGTPRFQECILRSSNSSINKAGDIIAGDVRQFMRDTKQRDDITVLGFNIKR